MKSSSLLRLSRFAILFLALCSAAIAAGTPPLPKCCVWRVTNAKAPFYLVGSIHALTPGDYPLPSPYELALNDARQFIFECDPKQDDQFAKQFAAAAKFPKGQDVTQTINPKALAWMRAHLESVHLAYNEKTKKYDIRLGTFDENKPGCRAR